MLQSLPDRYFALLHALAAKHIQNKNRAMVGHAPPNWLSKIIEQKRRVIERPIPLVERRAERDAIVDAIVDAIKSHPTGAILAEHADLPDVIFAALGIANECEREARRNPKPMAASPAVQASWFAFVELGVPHPDSGEQG